MPKRIVITGGPGTGKTALVEHLEASGHPCLHEIIREMTLEAKQAGGVGEAHTNPLAFVSDPQAFNKMILKGRIRQFHEAEQLQAARVFYDRGLPDVLAYMDYFKQPYDEDFTRPCRELRYDTAVVLPPWKAIYRQDAARMERFEQAEEIHRYLTRTYQKFGYRVHTLKPGTLEERAERLLRLIHTV